MSNDLREAPQQAKGRLLFQQQAELLLTELVGGGDPPTNWRELTTGALTQVVSPAANGVIVLPGKRTPRPLSACPIVSRNAPKQTGFELSKVICTLSGNTAGKVDVAGELFRTAKYVCRTATCRLPPCLSK